MHILQDLHNGSNSALALLPNGNVRRGRSVQSMTVNRKPHADNNALLFKILRMNFALPVNLSACICKHSLSTRTHIHTHLHNA